MRTPMIVGNWKMHKTIKEAVALVKALHYGLEFATVAELDIVVAPPYTALSQVADFLQHSFIGVGAQDLFWEEQGAFTGAISAPLIKEAGAEYVIVGHSERRTLFQESDAIVQKKLYAALAQGLVPIFCIGETLAEREAGNKEAVITAQLTHGIQELTATQITQVVIAYEPVWAIGTGKTATPEEAEEVHCLIRNLLQQYFGETTAALVKILYGGSVQATNSRALLGQPNIDGALVGGASLKAEQFIAIIKNAL